MSRSTGLREITHIERRKRDQDRSGYLYTARMDLVTRCMATDQRTFDKYPRWLAKGTQSAMNGVPSRVYEIIPCKASRFVDQEAAYRSFLHLRIFFLLTILLPQKNRE